jgi:hypothetical protein
MCAGALLLAPWEGCVQKNKVPFAEESTSGLPQRSAAQQPDGQLPASGA